MFHLFVGYPEDEAVSYDMLVYRQTEAPDLLIACYILSDLVGVSVSQFESLRCI